MVNDITIDLSEVSQEVRDTVPKVRTGGQVQEQLMWCLGEEIKKITHDIDFRDSDGNKTELNIFYQLTPYTYEEDEDEGIFPYCQVIFQNSDNKDVNEREEIKILLGFGITYEAKDRQYQHIFFQIYNRFRRRFIEDNFLENFRCEPRMKLGFDSYDEYTYPKYYAWIETTWMIPGIDRGYSQFS